MLAYHCASTALLHMTDQWFTRIDNSKLHQIWFLSPFAQVLPPGRMQSVLFSGGLSKSSKNIIWCATKEGLGSTSIFSFYK